MEAIETAEAMALRLDASVPRYTSYPTAPMFSADKAEEAYGGLMDAIDAEEAISLYMHIPFCDRLCWFCGCNTKHTLKYDPVNAYVGTLIDEMHQVRARKGFAPRLRHVHLGGGSPSFLSNDDLARLGAALRANFVCDDDTEISVEIDPSDMDGGKFDGLISLGITRASVGVQDFDADVQKAINRPQTFEQTRDVIGGLRDAGVASVNIDALYGLPLQTMARLEDTIAKVVSLTPDRIALFGYAHVPWMKKHQRLIRDEDLPDTVDRFRQAQTAERILVAAGYVKIGIDHFAKPTDTMAIASASGELRRNFQGYTTDTCPVLLGLGGSSISRYPKGYVQNHVATARYQEAVSEGAIPAAKGMLLSDDDRIRGAIIEALMCDFAVDFAQLRARFGGDATPYILEAETISLKDEDGLCEIDADGFRLTDAGKTFARIVASRFDAHLPNSSARHSKAV